MLLINIDVIFKNVNKNYHQFHVFKNSINILKDSEYDKPDIENLGVCSCTRMK